jgi:hypothetical protein
MLNILVAQVRLQRPGIVPSIGQGIAAGVPEQVRVGLGGQLGDLASPLDHSGEASGGERRAALGSEYEGRPGLLLPL